MLCLNRETNKIKSRKFINLDHFCQTMKLLFEVNERIYNFRLSTRIVEHTFRVIHFSFKFLE